MKYIYLHGFASSPQSKKAQFFKQKLLALGIGIKIVDLNSANFTKLKISEQIEKIQQLLTKEEPTTIIGSSMGGLIALNLAENNNSVTRLVLMAPALGIHQLWPSIIGAQNLIKWQTDRVLAVFHHGFNQLVDLDYAFIEDLAKIPDETFKRQIPSLIFHGQYDLTIPWDNSLQYSKNNQLAELNLLDSDHSLENQLDLLWNKTKEFIKL